MKNPPKDILTIERIREDLLMQEDKPSTVKMFQWIAFLAGCLLLTLILSLIFNTVVALIVTGLVIAVGIGIMLYKGKNIRQIKRKDFTVHKQELQFIKDEVRYYYTRHGGRIEIHDYYLQFPFSRWMAPDRCYSWSEYYHRNSEKALVESSHIGDEFYIVVLRGSFDIIHAYNCNYFTLQEETK